MTESNFLYKFRLDVLEASKFNQADLDSLNQDVFQDFPIASLDDDRIKDFIKNRVNKACDEIHKEVRKYKRTHGKGNAAIQVVGKVLTEDDYGRTLAVKDLKYPHTPLFRLDATSSFAGGEIYIGLHVVLRSGLDDKFNLDHALECMDDEYTLNPGDFMGSEKEVILQLAYYDPNCTKTKPWLDANVHKIRSRLKDMESVLWCGYNDLTRKHIF